MVASFPVPMTCVGDFEIVICHEGKSYGGRARLSLETGSILYLNNKNLFVHSFFPNGVLKRTISKLTKEKI